MVGDANITSPGETGTLESKLVLKATR